ncbi:MAG: DUF4170 domain-containing protein [Rhodospirillaceae bacterium]|nr:DUF4170 domain-containing protein [Rhodospirillaceae bacterium]MBL6931069.1 DUF4170 domain-containing protein [Rhodospirillales bacterium]
MTEKPLLHLVFGGHVEDPRKLDFTSCDNIDVVGIFPNYQEALDAWRGASHAHVDEADIKYVIVHLHRLFDPETGEAMEDHEHGPADA